MPDGHWGYGFPIGGFAAFRADTGVISPGGIGFDINCGMRVLRTGLNAPFRSPEGQAYFGAMTAAANTAFANRQLITHRVREVASR